MKNAELIIFILVVMINGGIALWKKYAELKAKRAAEALARPSAMSRAPAPAAPPRARGATAPVAKPKPVAKRKAPAKPKPTAKPKAPAKAPPTAEPRPGTLATRAGAALLTAVSPRPVAPVAAVGRPAGRQVSRAGRAGLRRAILLREVLGPPRALEPWRG
jgi:hypothetical protein